VCSGGRGRWVLAGGRLPPLLFVWRCFAVGAIHESPARGRCWRCVVGPGVPDGPQMKRIFVGTGDPSPTENQRPCCRGGVGVDTREDGLPRSLRSLAMTPKFVTHRDSCSTSQIYLSLRGGRRPTWQSVTPVPAKVRYVSAVRCRARRPRRAANAVQIRRDGKPVPY